MLRGRANAAPESIADAHAVLDRLWEHLLGSHLASDELTRLARQVEAQAPVAEANDRWTAEAAFIENALAALAYALQTAVTGDPQLAVWSARQAIEALDLDASERLGVRTYDEESEAAIAADPLVQAELGRQEADLRDAASINPGDPRSVTALRDRAQRDALVFLGQ